MVKLVDTSDLGSDAVRCGGSSPSIRTVELRTMNKDHGKFFSKFILNLEIWLQLQREYWFAER